MDDQTVKSSDSFDILYSNKGQIIQTPKGISFYLYIEKLNAFKWDILKNAMSPNIKVENKAEEILTSLRKIK